MKNAGFTLLEVVIALAILGISLMAIFDINSQAVYGHIYARKLTVATLLARSKMIDLEQELYDEGLNAHDKEQTGDFSDEGWPSYKWQSKIIVPKTTGLTPTQLFGALFNLPTGGSEEGAPGLLGALFGTSGDAAQAAGLPPGTQPANASGMLSALGPMAGIAQAQFTQMVEQLKQSVREVHLSVSWKEGELTESVDLVTHVVSLGPGSDVNGALQSATPPQNNTRYVRQDGTPARNPKPSPTGTGMVDDDGTPLRTIAPRLNISPDLFKIPRINNKLVVPSARNLQ